MKTHRFVSVTIPKKICKNDARFVEVCHPRSQKLDDIRQMVPHLQFNIMTDWGELDSSDGIR